ncbi:LOW QUALITY PROTEIN: hypothetical protein CVT26_003368 [Gymnopilus dilepis]|uniref:Uncharacterized protein n=1 Tax=Gymnopilus dilepis TaxID=231916 RepID=A0A409VQQ0_9AGAR|nr:LOW QUALITY PROTEIN: hypothetical protein CVT26_003368 [Gymnopilus dilepis]
MSQIYRDPSIVEQIDNTSRTLTIHPPIRLRSVSGLSSSGVDSAGEHEKSNSAAPTSSTRSESRRAACAVPRRLSRMW